jgi:hypothetical protein
MGRGSFLRTGRGPPQEVQNGNHERALPNLLQAHASPRRFPDSFIGCATVSSLFDPTRHLFCTLNCDMLIELSAGRLRNLNTAYATAWPITPRR